MNLNLPLRRRWRLAVGAMLAFTLIAIFGSRSKAENRLPILSAPAAASAGEQIRPANFGSPAAADSQAVAAGGTEQKPAPADVGLAGMGPNGKCTEQRLVTDINTNINAKPPRDSKENVGKPEDVDKDIHPVCDPSQTFAHYAMTPRVWTPLCYCWEAPSLCYGPLYFEESNLERYGYSQTYLRRVQPLVSSAHFFGTIPTLPYLMVAEPSRECVYTLGQYRPGSCVPFQWNYPYFSPCAPGQMGDK